MEYRKQLLVLAKNDAKQRSWNYNMKVNDVLHELRSVLSHAYSETIELTNKSKQKEYVKKRNHLIEK